MSGFEIAGVVLGAVPVLIAAVEQYNKALDPVKAFFQWQETLKEARRTLWHQRTSYELTLQALLKGLASNTELEEMMENPRSDLWSSRDIRLGIEEKLGVAYPNYLDTVREIGTAMTTLSTHLDIDKASGVLCFPDPVFVHCAVLNRVSQKTRSELEAVVIANPPVTTSERGKPRFEFRRRVKFTMRRREVAALMQKLNECNERLDKYLEKAEKLDDGPVTKPRGRSTFTVPLSQIQEYANSLHCILTRAWGCLAHDAHCANLLLEPRTKLPKGHETRFTLSFLDPSLSSRWQDAEIRVVDSSTSTIGGIGRVGFVVSPPTPSSTPAPNDNTSSLKEITDLCLTLRQGQSPPACLEFHLDCQTRLLGIRTVKKQHSNSDGFITLEELLTAPPMENGRPAKLSTGDSYQLAVTLTSSFLQLHTTPWISSEWTRKDVVFPMNGSASNKRVDFKRPHVTKLYLSSNSNPPAIIAATPDNDGGRLLKLGTMLLEIFCGQRIEDRKQEENLAISGNSDDVTNLGVLRRWIKAKEQEGNLSWATKDAISHYIACFADPRADLQNTDFRQGVIEKVILPLLDELHHWKGAA